MAPQSNPQAATVVPLPVDLLRGAGTAAPAAPPALSAAPDALGLLKALRARWFLALSTGLVCAVTAAVVAWYVLPPRYTATSLVRIAARRPKVAFSTTEDNVSFESYKQTQIALIKSRFVLNKALDHPAVQKLSIVKEQLDPVEWLEKLIKVDSTGNSEILNINLSGDRPEELGTLVKAVTDAYFKEVVDKEKTEQQDRLEQLKEVYGTYEERLRKQRGMLKHLAEESGSNDPQTSALRHRFALEQLAMSQQELMRLQSDLRRQRIELAGEQQRAKTLPDAPVSEVALDEALQREPAVQQIQTTVAEWEDAVARAEQVAARGKGDPTVRKYTAGLETARAALAARRAKLRPGIVQQIRAKAAIEIQTRVAGLQQQVGLLQELEKELEHVVAGLENQTRLINRSSVDQELIRDEIAQADDFNKRVGSELESLTVELKAPPRIVMLSDAGSVPHQMDPKRRTMFAGMSGAGSLALALLGIAWWEFRARRIRSTDEVVHGLGLRLVGALPPMPERTRRLVGAAAAADLDREALLIESVDATRTMLLHAAAEEALRVVLVTSAVGGEGKTSLACHLATSLARADRRTLLVDCDLRSPAAHRLFDLPLGPGFAELLRGEAELADVVQATMMTGLSMISAGACDARAIGALAHPRAGAIFDRLKEQYDFIVVDSSPVLPVVDSLLISQHVDAVLFAILHEVSRLPLVYAAYQRLATLGVRMLGAVVNGARSEVYNHSYRYATQARN